MRKIRLQKFTIEEAQIGVPFVVRNILSSDESRHNITVIKLNDKEYTVNGRTVLPIDDMVTEEWYLIDYPDDLNLPKWF